ncbi:MAG TPA: glycine cleavage system protein H [Actinomycetota bacterium]
MLEASPDEIHYGCVIPRDLLYDVEADVWIRLEGDEAVIGMTDPAQTRCGKIVAVDFRRVGKLIERGRGLATIESAKWVGPVPSPLTGEIVTVNSATFNRDILIANRDPYGEGWLVRLRPDALDEERGMLQAWDEAFAAYKQRIDELEIRCFRCAD